MTASHRFLVTLCLLCAVAPIGAGEGGGGGDPIYFYDRDSYESATSQIDTTTETFQSFAPGTCLDIVCPEPGQVDGVQFTSPNSDYCGEPLLQACEYIPVQAAQDFGESTGEGPLVPVVLGGGWAEEYGGKSVTETSFSLEFDPAVVTFGFDLVAFYDSVVIEIEFEDGSPSPPPEYLYEDDFFGALSSRRISRVLVESTPPGATDSMAPRFRNDTASGGAVEFGDAWDDVIVGSPTGTYEIGSYALDNLSFNLPPQPPLCERIASGANATTVIEGQATGDAAGGALDPPVLQTAFPSNLTLTFTFETPNQILFYVEFDELVPAAQGVVVVTDQAGGQCSLPVDFQQLPPGPVEGTEICVDEQDGIVVQIENPAPGEIGPGTEGGTLACSGQPPDVEAFPPGYIPSPEDDPWPCVEFIIESPVFGTTQMVYKKDGIFDPRLRLLFANWVGGNFEDYSDITESVEEIAYIIPDPSRLVGKARWSPVRITCAILAPDCALLPECNALGEPGCIDDDADGEPLCLMGQLFDCNDQNEQINSLAGEICNGLDDNCNGTIDEGFDRDGDGVYDCFDNCPDHYNPGQEDSNGDGIGDACPLDDEGSDEDDDEGDDEGDDERSDYPEPLEDDYGSDEADADLSTATHGLDDRTLHLHEEELQDSGRKAGDASPGRTGRGGRR